MTKILICLVLVIVVIGVLVSCHSCNGEGTAQPKPLTEAEEMPQLIERLANTYRKPITLGADAVIYQPKEDKTVRDEILAKGFDAVPYLITGLNHKNPDIAARCAGLLEKLPRQSGIAALVKCLDNQEWTWFFLQNVHSALHELTGFDKSLPPGGISSPDIKRIRKIWLPWWEANKDRIVDTDTGIGLKNDDGTITPLPLKEK